MQDQCDSNTAEVNSTPDFDFNVNDPNAWYRYVADEFVLRGKARRTGEAYAREVRILVKHFQRPPFVLKEAEVRDFILIRHQKLKGSSQRILYRGLRVLFNDLLGCNWTLLKTARAKREEVVPVILSRSEVSELFRAAHSQHVYTFLRTVYSCGLRLSEARWLKVGDIDRARMIIHVRKAKGAKERQVPLPKATLRMIGCYWKTHRNPTFIFPALGRDGKGGPTADKPMSICALQGALRRTVKRAGIKKSGVRIHTLRHSYATHLLEADVRLPVLQKLLGHKHLHTTLRYVHLSKLAMTDAVAIIDNLMSIIK